MPKQRKLKEREFSKDKAKKTPTTEADQNNKRGREKHQKDQRRS